LSTAQTSLQPMGFRRGGGNGRLPPPGNCDKERNFSRRVEISSSVPINWFKSCSGRFCTSMTLTLHASQVHCFGVMHCYDVMVLRSDELADHSCPLLC